jgi:ribosomal protein L11 methylase PrmA
MTLPLKDHWNKKYTNTPTTQLGWYEVESTPSLQFIEHCAVAKDAMLVDVGSGVSTLVASLLELGYQNIHAVDISEVALEKAKAMLTKEQAEQVHWIVDDITAPSSLLQLQNVAVWHDRAVFHFLTDEKDRQTYHSLLQQVVAPGGFVILSAFAMNGATMCSGLPVQRHSVESLSDFFGDGFSLIESMDYVYQNPSGEPRPYVYTRFQKTKLDDE